LLHTLKVIGVISIEFPTIGAHRGARVNRIKTPWVKLSGNNFELWKVKMEAILMVEKMDKTWSVVIRCLEDKKVKEIAVSDEAYEEGYESAGALIVTSLEP
jgi:hypothetical protein